RRVGDAFYIKAGEVGDGCLFGNFPAMSVIFFKISMIFSRFPGFLSRAGADRCACVGILSMWRSVARIFHHDSRLRNSPDSDRRARRVTHWERSTEAHPPSPRRAS